MLPVAEIHQIAAVLRPNTVGLSLLLFGSLLTGVCAVLRGRSLGLGGNAAVIYVAAAAAVLWPLPYPHLSMQVQLAVAAVVAAALILAVERRIDPDAGGADDERTARASRRYLVVFSLIAAGLLFRDLGGYAGDMLTWEGEVIQGFRDAFLGGRSVAEFTAERFLWEDGLMSSAHGSLFFGAPAYALFHVWGFTPWMLRVSSAAAALLGILVAYAFGRRFFSPLVGVALAGLFLVDPAVIFYGRYGSSPAGTVLAVLLAILATYWFLDAQRAAWWRAIPCAAALYVATLQYSPARLIVLTLLGFIALTTLVQWRRCGWSRAIGVAIIAASVWGVWHLEGTFQRQGEFLAARGEHYFAMLRAPSVVDSLLGHPLCGNPRGPADMTLPKKAELAAMLLQTNVPQFASLILPNPRGAATRRGMLFEFDPPRLPLYYLPAALFIAWGLLLSLSRWRDWKYQFFLLWLWVTVPLLLTNRVDAHRIVLFIIPLSVWGALGLREAALVMSRAGVPAVARHLLAAGLVLAGVMNEVRLLIPKSSPGRTASGALLDEAMRVPGPVRVGGDWEQQGRALVQLGMLERARRYPQWEAGILPQGTVEKLTNRGRKEPLEFFVNQLRRDAQKSTVFLAPADNFRKVAAAMQAGGRRVAEGGLPTLRFLRIDAGEASSGIPDSEVNLLPTIHVPPTPTPISLRTGPQVPLTDLVPLEVKFGFQAPAFRRNDEGPPIVLGGVSYPSGLYTHAPMKLTYAVPAGARWLQAVIGIEDAIKDCDKAAVTFEVRGPNDELLFDSGLIDVSSPPRPILVDLGNASRITLVVTDAGNGIDCDHAEWAVPSFVMAE